MSKTSAATKPFDFKNKNSKKHIVIETIVKTTLNKLADLNRLVICQHPLSKQPIKNKPYCSYNSC